MSGFVVGALIGLLMLLVLAAVLAALIVSFCFGALFILKLHEDDLQDLRDQLEERGVEGVN